MLVGELLILRRFGWSFPPFPAVVRNRPRREELAWSRQPGAEEQWASALNLIAFSGTAVHHVLTIPIYTVIGSVKNLTKITQLARIGTRAAGFRILCLTWC